MPAIPFLGWLLCTFVYSFDDPKALGILATAALLAVLCWPLGKRGRLHLFQSDQAKREISRRGWIESLIVFGVLIGSGLLISQIIPGMFKKGGSGLISGLFTFIAVSLRTRRSVRSCGFKSGWFALANVDPAAIAHLAEIESRLDQPPLSRKP